jgi:uncharacterized membrane protein
MEPLVKSFLVLHIAGGSLAIVSGYAALFASKGGWLHRRAGVLFVYSMLALGAGALVVGLARDKSTWLGGPFVFYLVLTSMFTVSRSHTPSRSTNIALMALGTAVCLISTYGGVRGLLGPPGPIGHAPDVMSLVNAFVLLLCVTGDFRIVRSGPAVGTRRLRRHLWRMCYAMFVATGSFFLGQAKVIPEPLRIKPLLLLLAFLPLPAMFYFLWRPRRRTKKMVAHNPIAAVDIRSPQYELRNDALEVMK